MFPVAWHPGHMWRENVIWSADCLHLSVICCLNVIRISLVNVQTLQVKQYQKVKTVITNVVRCKRKKKATLNLHKLTFVVIYTLIS